MTVTWMRAGSLKSLECILDQKQTSKIKRLTWDFPESPVVQTLPSNAGGMESISGQGAKISHSWDQNIKRTKAML